MRTRFTLALASTGLALMLLASIVPARVRVEAAPAPGAGQAAAGQNAASKIPDLSADWTPDPKRGGFGQSFSLSDTGGRKRGQEDDIPYQPWAREKTLSEKPSTGPNPYFGETTDPQVLYCEPPGVPHIYLWPIKTKFIQTPEAVYILYELGPYYRVVWLNAKHPEDPDPQWWGHSIGHYENGDTLVVDSIGFNDKTWLDQMGHPHTEKLHLIERYKRVDANTLELDLTIDDPGAYTKPWNGHRNFTTSKTGFLRYQQICSVRENQAFTDALYKPAAK
jgi:hypothetical protein